MKKKTRKASIGARVYVVLVILLVMFIITAIGNSTSLNRIKENSALTQEYNQLQKSYLEVSNVYAKVQVNSLAYMLGFVTGDSAATDTGSGIETLNTNLKAMDNAVAKVAATGTSDASELASAYEDWKNHVSTFIELQNKIHEVLLNTKSEVTGLENPEFFLM